MRVRAYSKAINRYGVSITELQVIILFNSMWEDFVIRLFVNKKHQRDADQHTNYLIDAQQKAIDLLEKTASDIKSDRRYKVVVPEGCDGWLYCRECGGMGAGSIHHEDCRYLAFLNGEESE